MKRGQPKKYVYTFIEALCSMVLLIGCKSMNATRKVEKVENMLLDTIVYIAETSSKELGIQAQYLMLNRDIFGKELTLWFTEEMKEEICEYSEQVKGEFGEVQNFHMTSNQDN